jgi:hypothetical protein
MKRTLMVAITLLAMGCLPKIEVPKYNIVTHKRYVIIGFVIDTRLPDSICQYASTKGIFQDSCNKYNIGDTIK